MAMASISLPDGRVVPALGQGTWMMGEDSARRATEMAAIRTGVDLGLKVIDTAEMYGGGATETFLGEALRGLRDEIFLVSKVLPDNAGASRLAKACEGSLTRLQTDRIDLYLLHWRGRVPLAETVVALDRLVAAGKIGAWGVSNLDVADLEELGPAASRCATNQILYNLTRRGPEFDLLPWMRNRSMPAMAYSPVEQGRLVDHPAVAAIASRHEVAPAQIALAWALRTPGMIVIPKSGSLAHVRQNHAAASLRLDDADLAALDRAFPPPHRKQSLAML